MAGPWDALGAGISTGLQNVMEGLRLRYSREESEKERRQRQKEARAEQKLAAQGLGLQRRQLGATIREGARGRGLERSLAEDEAALERELAQLRAQVEREKMRSQEGIAAGAKEAIDDELWPNLYNKETGELDYTTFGSYLNNYIIPQYFKDIPLEEVLGSPEAISRIAGIFASQFGNEKQADVIREDITNALYMSFGMERPTVEPPPPPPPDKPPPSGRPLDLRRIFGGGEAEPRPEPEKKVLSEEEKLNQINLAITSMEEAISKMAPDDPNRQIYLQSLNELKARRASLTGQG